MIKTTHLQLIPCDPIHFEAFIKDELAALLDVTVAPDWFGFSDTQEAMMPGYHHLKSHPSAFGWWMYLIVHVTDRTLMGMGCFKGEPDRNGVVEIGYSIAPTYWRRGLATEAAEGLINFAFSHSKVLSVRAHTLPEKNASTCVLEKLGMKHVGVMDHPDDGKVWRWVLTREEESGNSARLISNF